MLYLETSYGFVYMQHTFWYTRYLQSVLIDPSRRVNIHTARSLLALFVPAVSKYSECYKVLQLRIVYCA